MKRIHLRMQVQLEGGPIISQLIRFKLDTHTYTLLDQSEGLQAQVSM